MNVHHPGLPIRPVYLDYNATTPIDPRVAEALQPVPGRLVRQPGQSPRPRRRTGRCAAYRACAARRLYRRRPRRRHL